MTIFDLAMCLISSFYNQTKHKHSEKQVDNPPPKKKKRVCKFYWKFTKTWLHTDVKQGINLLHID